MPIITNLQVDSNHKTCYATDTYQQMLVKGEAWEGLVFEYLRAQGLTADRYHQDLSCLRRNRKFKLFPRFQRDGFIIMPWGRLNIEVKARANNPFTWGTVHVGRQEAWDVKAFPVHFLIIVCQETGVMKYTEANKNIRSRRWIKTTSKDECYTVPIDNFRPIERLIKACHEWYIPNNHHAYKKFGYRFDRYDPEKIRSTAVRLGT